MRVDARRTASARGPLAQDFLGVLSARRSAAYRQIRRRHQGRIRARQVAGEQPGEERVVAQLEWLEHPPPPASRPAEKKGPPPPPARRAQRGPPPGPPAIRTPNRPRHP